MKFLRNETIFGNLATHLNNGPSSEPSPATLQQLQPQQQAPPITVSNKRHAPPNPVSTIQASPINNIQLNENGVDYRGHHQMNQAQPPTSQATQISNIRFNFQLDKISQIFQLFWFFRHSPAIPKGSVTHVVNIDGPNPNQHPQFPSNAQFQHMYQQSTHVNSVRGRQGNAFQAQQAPAGYSQVHKTKN